MLGAGAFTENFRSALNGFNRTDVVQFIQRQTVEHEKSIRLLREENARLKQASSEPKEDTEALQAEKEELARQLAQKEEELAAFRQQNAELRTEMDLLVSQKAAAEASLSEARAALASAEEAAAAAKDPAPSLDRPIAAPAGMTAPPANFDEMELAAYRRAEQTERLARERAVAASQRMQSIFRQADEKMTLTAADMNTLLDSFRDSYEQIQVLMENARNILSESSESLKVSGDLSSLV